MEERLRFVAQLLDGEAMSEVCRAFGISRKTGYKIFERYKEHGLEALTDRSRRPVRYAMGGLLTGVALVMPRTGRRAYILLCMVPGRGNPSVRCRRCDHRLVLTETRQALLMELGIGNRTTLFAHARLAESAVCFKEPIVTFALDDVLPGSIRTDGHGYDGRQASRREGQADRSLKDHDNHLR
jgi:Helix-turn-helix domain